MVGDPNLPVGEFFVGLMEVPGFFEGWHNNSLESLVQFAIDHAVAQPVDAGIVGSVEDPEHPSTREIYTVPTGLIRIELPWLDDMYERFFVTLAQVASGDESLVGASKPENRMNINIQYPPSSPEEVADGYDGHVDFNAMSAIAYVGGGSGELRVARNPEAQSIADIDADHAAVEPETGKIVIFNGRYPHYVRPTEYGQPPRVAVAMNFYNPEYPESIRPQAVADYSQAHGQ
jgi:hypothetical protein